MRGSSSGQVEIEFVHGGEPAPATLADVERLVTILKGRKWMTGPLLASQLGKGWSDRKVRRVARAAAPVIVSFPGAPGYKLWAECSVEEIDRAIKSFESQARDMAARALLYQRAFHARFRGGLS